jgi:hypothetical protein|tara:strand:- start:470 stop:1756 length:1287 start_codon:yes stop_codon:yes gene_type:complete
MGNNIKKVTFIGFKDYANCMTEYSKAINKHCDGFESKIICECAHPIDFETKHDYDLLTYDESKDKWLRNESQIEEAKKWISESSHIILGEEKGPQIIHEPQYYYEKFGQSWQLEAIKECSKMNPESSLGTLKDIFTNILNMSIVKDTKAGRDNNLHLYHTGSVFRNQPDVFNLIGSTHFNKIIHGVDLYRLSWNDLSTEDQNLLGITSSYKPQNNLAIYTSYDRDSEKERITKLINEKFNTNKIIIFHAPTSKEMKGTNIITAVVSGLVSYMNKWNKKKGIDMEYEYLTPESYEPTKKLMDPSTGWIPNSEIMKIKEMAHIYIDEFNPQVGYFGGSTVEALMSGNVAFATINNFTIDAMKAANKNIKSSLCPVIHLGADPKQFRDILKTVLEKPVEELKDLAHQSLQWYYETSTHKAVATKFEKEILL